MRFTDIALNLTARPFGDHPGTLLERARSAGVHRCVALASDLAETALLQHRWDDLAQPPGLCLTAGVHPHYASEWDDTSSDRLRALAAHPAVVAIGESGLDYCRDFSPRPAQRAAFEAQLALAAELNRPLVLHCRDAYEDFLPLVARYRDRLPGAVLHCFTGNAAELEAALALDLHIGVTGWVCDERRGNELRTLVPRIPDDRLLLETDAPYLVPRDIRPRPKHNEPALLPHIAVAVARLRGQSLGVLAQNCENNVLDLFGL